MIDAYVERNKKTQSKKGKKNIGGMDETKSQKFSEYKWTKLEVKNPGQYEHQTVRETEEHGNRILTNEPTPVDQGHDFATSTATLDREEMSEVSNISIENPTVRN